MSATESIAGGRRNDDKNKCDGSNNRYLHGRFQNEYEYRHLNFLKLIVSCLKFRYLNAYLGII